MFCHIFLIGTLVVLATVTARDVQHIFNPSRNTVAASAPEPQSHVASLNLTLTPLFLDKDAPEDPSALAVTMSVSDPDLSSHAKLVVLPLMIDNVPTSRYDGDALQAYDDLGHLELTVDDVDIPGERTWRPMRDTVGVVNLEFVAYPRNANRETPPGPRIDMRREKGGLTCAGSVFVPSLVNNTQVFDMKILWNLTGAPPKARGVWTWGDSITSTHRGPALDLQNAFYAVGFVQSYTSPEMPGYGFYWFDTIPFDAPKVAKDVQALYSRMSEFFEDEGSSYRIFVRHAFAYGGTALKWSFMIEYADDTQFDEVDLFFLLSHETVHNWPHMEYIEGKSEYNEWSTAWYIEGVANFYQDWAPYRFGLVSARQFLKSVNSVATAYYLSPVRHSTLEESTRDVWNDVGSLKLHYDRGAVYIARLNGLIRQASSNTRSIDQPVRELLHAARSGKSFDLEKWQILLGSEVGKDAAHHEYNAMADGKLIVPPSGAYGPCFKLVRHDKLIFDMGFKIDPNIITQLNESSRAALSGLRNGDYIIHRSSTYWALTEQYQANITITVQRQGEKNPLVYSLWPHGWEEVEAYEWVLNTDTMGDLRCT